MEEYYIPTAFFACRSDLDKSELRDNLAQIVINSLGIKDKTATTPWKISLYHIEEFEIHFGEDKHKHLQRLKEIYNKDGKSIEMPCLSSDDMGTSRFNAQLLLEKPNTTKVIEKVGERKLNYIIHGKYDNSYSLTRINFTDDSEVHMALQNIVSGLVNIRSKYRIIELNNCFYAYNHKGEFEFV
jgi:hypothetical protein